MEDTNRIVGSGMGGRREEEEEVGARALRACGFVG